MYLIIFRTYKDLSLHQGKNEKQSGAMCKSN